MKSTYTLKGQDAIRIAARDGITLRKYADPIEDARDGLSADEAAEIAKEDPSLIYATVTPSGWTSDPDLADSPELAATDISTDVIEGYNADQYFRDGEYLGADQHGIEPTFADSITE